MIGGGRGRGLKSVGTVEVRDANKTLELRQGSVAP